MSDRQETLTVGNAAKLREALVGLIDGICFHCDMSGDCKGVPCEKMQKAKAALSAPPRNCDVGTAEEQSDRYEAHCDAYHKATGTCDDCPIYKEECKMTGNIPHCQLVWAQMPYEEGGAK